MRGLCGWFSGKPTPDAEGQLRRMLSESRAPSDDCRLAAASHAGVAVFGASPRPTLRQADGCVLAVVGHPRLCIDGRRSADPADLLHALRTRGQGALADIAGEFAIAFWDAASRRGLLAVDRIGVQRLFYGHCGDTLAFASSLDVLAGHSDIVRTLSPQGLFDYVFHHVSPGPATVFNGLLCLPPGHSITFGANGSEGARAYWTMRFREDHSADQNDLEREFVSLLQAAVDESSQDATCGAFLSGGTDSSTVSGMLGRAGGRPARTFSIGFQVSGYDEMEYARIAAKHFGCEHHEYYVTPQDVVDAVPRIAASYDQPFGNASAIPTYYCARLAREHGVQRMLAGDGGDELFGGNERYSTQYLLSLYQKVPLPLRSLLVEPALLGIPGMHRVPLLKKLRSYVMQARPPMPQRYASHTVLTHLGVENVFTADFLGTVDIDHPQQLLAEVHSPYAGDSLVNQMLGIDLKFILADGDLPKVTHMCELADIDVAFPLLDDRIVEFSQRLTAQHKLRGRTLRWFFKHALRDFLPPAVITKQKHGFGLPVGAWLVDHQPLFDLAADGIGKLRGRGIVQPKFIDELLTTRLREHPAYFGTMVWVLMMLGLWLDSRRL
jgi:asparagine synthase (glutamine-hydrolysing)